MADTIYAQASAPGKAGVSVIRVSGPAAFAGVARMCDLPALRKAGLRQIRDDRGQLLDSGLVLCFPAGSSFTGEDVVELQVHGSLAVIRGVMENLSKLPGFRPAAPGEFTRRALENDRMDLAQVEGLADLIDAETELQRVQAQSSLSGGLAKRVDTWRESLIDAASLLELTLDFADEDVPTDVDTDVAGLLRSVAEDMERELRAADVAERIRTGFEIALIGPPNAGKSTLLNAIARRPVALTSEIAGTTRDVIEVRVDLKGIPVTMLDTAGLRESLDPIERQGIALTRIRAAAADVRVWLDDGSTKVPEGMDIVLLAQDDDGTRGGVSGKTGAGVTELLGRLQSLLESRVPKDALALRNRHRASLERAIASLREICGELTSSPSELSAQRVRDVIRDLQELIGGVDTEDLLGSIFSRFCIGK